MNREEHESYARRIKQLENQNKLLLDQLANCDAITPRLYEIKCDKTLIEESITQENTQLKEDLKMIRENTGNSTNRLYWKNKELKADLQALRQRLKGLKYSIDVYWNEHGEKAMRSVCSACRELYEIGHKEDCWIKTEIDKLEGVE